VLDEPLAFTGDGSAPLEHAPAWPEAIEAQTSLPVLAQLLAETRQGTPRSYSLGWEAL